MWTPTVADGRRIDPCAMHQVDPARFSDSGRSHEFDVCAGCDHSLRASVNTTGWRFLPIQKKSMPLTFMGEGTFLVELLS